MYGFLLFIHRGMRDCHLYYNISVFIVSIVRSTYHFRTFVPDLLVFIRVFV